MNTPFKLVTFDADDTLWDFTRMKWRGLRAVHDELLRMDKAHSAAQNAAQGATRYGHLTVESLDKLVSEFFARVDEQVIDYMTERRKAFAHALVSAGDSPESAEQDAARLITIYETHRDERLEVFPDTHATLEALKGVYTLGWITNGPARPPRIDGEAYFSVVIDKHTLGVRKPRPEVFEHAASVVGCEKYEIVHIGDSLVTDVAGVQSVRGYGVWYNYRQERNLTGIEPDAEIHTLREVLNLLL